MLRLQERNSNVFYLMVWLGYPYVNIPYVRRKREIGKSRWTLKKKVKLLIDSLLAFSFFPIRAISVLGLVLGLVAFALRPLHHRPAAIRQPASPKAGRP